MAFVFGALTLAFSCLAVIADRPEVFERLRFSAGPISIDQIPDRSIMKTTYHGIYLPHAGVVWAGVATAAGNERGGAESWGGRCAN